MKLNQIKCMDAIEYLKQIKDNSVDLILTDPPYNISKLNDQRDRSKLNSPIMRRKKSLNYDFGEWDNMERKDFLEFTDKWLKESCRIVKEGGVIISFFNKEDISYLGWRARNYDIRTRTIICWHKTNPVPSFRKVNYLSACEFIWIGSKGQKTWTFNFSLQKEMHNFFETPNSSAYGETKHPTEKPLIILKKLIKLHSNPNDTVLDCFIGSGTTAIASIQTQRNFIGCDNCQEYVDIANARIKKEQQQKKLW